MNVFLWEVQRGMLPFSLLCLLLIVFALLAPSKCLGEEKLEIEYQKQLERLSRQTNPVGKTKVYIKMSQIDLDLASDEIKKGNLDEADKFFVRLTDVIQQAQRTLKASGRNAQKNPSGFKELEIALRRHLRRLSDLKTNYPFDQQEKISQAISTAESAKEEMLLAIFGPENTRRKGKDGETGRHEK